MSGTYDIYPFSERESVAAAVATLLVQPHTPDPESAADVAEHFDVNLDSLGEAVDRLGLVDTELDLPEQTGTGSGPRTDVPEVLTERDPVTREYGGGLRCPDHEDDRTRTTELSFQSWLFVEATKRARERVERLLREAFGDAVDAISVSMSGTIGTAAFPERILWIGVHYPVDVSDGPRTVVLNPPPFSFERLAATLPSTVDVAVERAGETFRVRNLPVVPYREARIS